MNRFVVKALVLTVIAIVLFWSVPVFASDGGIPVELLLILLSPVAMIFVAVIAVIIAELKHLPKPSAGYLASLSIILAMVGLFGSLLLTIG